MVKIVKKITLVAIILFVMCIPAVSRAAYYSQSQLPDAILVARTFKDKCIDFDFSQNTPEIVSVPFKQYVKDVLRVEWGPVSGIQANDWETEALKSGAIATKMFAWYKMIISTGAGKQYGAHVLDCDWDQVYQPDFSQEEKPSFKTDPAVEATWDEVMKREFASVLFELYFRDSDANCAISGSQPCMPQLNTQTDAQNELNYIQILKKYYSKDSYYTQNGNSTPLTFHTNQQLEQGDTVQALFDVNMRDAPAGVKKETIPKGMKGTIVAKPESKQMGQVYYLWYNIKWENGSVGWVADGYIILVPAEKSDEYLKSLSWDEIPSLQAGLSSP